MYLFAKQEYRHAVALIRKSQQEISAIFNNTNLLTIDAGMPIVERCYSAILQNEGVLVSLLRLERRADLHALAVSSLMMVLAKSLNMSESEIKQAGLAGLLHDIGKVFLPLELLNKPSKLSGEEYALIMTHPKKGHDFLVQQGIVDPVVLDVCLHHHEKMDGTGYPKKLTSDSISVFVKMASICDVYDAIAISRPYKLGWGVSRSFKSMLRWDGHFDQVVLDAFVKRVISHPVGSVVVLKSGRLAVVVEQSQVDLFRPMVKVFYSTKYNAQIPEEYLDLSHPNVQDEIVEQSFSATWGLYDLDGMWQ